MMVALGATGLLVVLTLCRIALAAAVLRRPEPQFLPVSGHDAAQVTVLQTILSGDPTLRDNLLETLTNQPEARFVWLVDESDAAGLRIAQELAPTAGGRVAIIEVPPAGQGHNPKVFKLVIGLPLCGELVAVLDDDTVLPPGALERATRALTDGDLVTGLPVYRQGRGIYSRLLAGFVNGNALLTYLPILVFAKPATINGMFCLTRRSVLEALGGFSAIEDRLCDDYEMAKLYRNAGLRIAQTTITHPLSTTVPGFRAYVRLMRRWMVCANQLLREETLKLPTLCLVVIPSLLPLIAMVLAGVSGSMVALTATLGALILKAIALAVLRRLVSAEAAAENTGKVVTEIVAEVVADLLLPLHAMTAFVRPHRVRWRDKAIDLTSGRVEYRQTSAPTPDRGQAS